MSGSSSTSRIRSRAIVGKASMEFSTGPAEKSAEMAPGGPVETRSDGPFHALTKALCNSRKPLRNIELQESVSFGESTAARTVERFPQNPCDGGAIRMLTPCEAG